MSKIRLISIIIITMVLAAAVWFAISRNTEFRRGDKPEIKPLEKPLEPEVAKNAKAKVVKPIAGPRKYTPVKLNVPQDIIGYIRIAPLDDVYSRVKEFSDGARVSITVDDIQEWVSSFIENVTFVGVDQGREIFAVLFDPTKCKPMGAVVMPLADRTAFLKQLAKAFKVRKLNGDLYTLIIPTARGQFDRYFLRFRDKSVIGATRREAVQALADWSALDSELGKVKRMNQATVRLETRKLFAIYKDSLSAFIKDAKKRTQFLETAPGAKPGELKSVDRLLEWIVDLFTSYLSQTEYVDINIGFDRRGLTCSVRTKAIDGTDLFHIFNEETPDEENMMRYLPRNTFFGGCLRAGKKASRSIMRCFAQFVKVTSHGGDEVDIKTYHENLGALFGGAGKGSEIAFGFLGPSKPDEFALTYVQVFRVADVRVAFDKIYSYVQKVGRLPLLGKTGKMELIEWDEPYKGAPIFMIHDSDFDFTKVPDEDDKLVYRLVFQGNEPHYVISIVGDKVLVAMGSGAFEVIKDMIDCVLGVKKGLSATRRYAVATGMLPTKNNHAMLYLAPTEIARLFYLLKRDMFGKGDLFDSVINLPQIPWPNSGIGFVLRRPAKGVGELKIYVPPAQIKELQQLKRALGNKDELPVPGNAPPKK